MPNKRKPKKETLSILTNGKSVAVTLSPPTDKRKSWYVYWNGLTYSRSTGTRDLREAREVAEAMFRNGGSRAASADGLLSDDEFDEIQRRHYRKLTSRRKNIDESKSLKSCMEAVSAFREISGLVPITIATVDDAERFQNEALKLPKNWRSKHPNSKNAQRLSRNTVYKWLTALRAAFERANRNAGRKCVRGVVDEAKLLSENVFDKFTWIEEEEKEIRQFAGAELISLLDFFDAKWSQVTVAPLLAKVLLWSWARKSEIAGLEWNSLRQVHGEIHFDVIGKWSIDKWFRIPSEIYQELLAIRTDSPFVFAAYNRQLRSFHENSVRPWLANRVGNNFKPANVGDWFYDRLKDWAASEGIESAYIHVFRKTTLQYARSGEDLNRIVAADARLGESVMMKSYVNETDEEMRQKSNRTFQRIANSLSPEVALRFGYKTTIDPLLAELRNAEAAGDWRNVARLATATAENGGSL